MPQSPDVQTVINDPKFLQLPAQEQKKVLLKIDSNFKSLDEVQQNLVVSRLHFPQPTKPLKGNADNPVTRGVKAFGTRAADTVTGLGHLIADPPNEEEKAATLLSGRASLPIYRIGKGFVEAEKEAGKQTKQSGKDTAELARQGHYGESALQGVKTGVTAASMLDPFATSSVANVNQLQSEGKNAEAVGQGLFDAMTLALGSKWGRGKVPNTGTLSRLSKLAPKVVDVEGVKFIVPVGEAEESAVSSKAGLKQSQYKKAGIGAKEFDEINRYNQAAAREVIRKVSQKTSGMTGPMSEAAGTATKKSGDWVLEQARPMYRAIDSALSGPPEMRVITNNMSEAVQKAFSKVEKYGVPRQQFGLSAHGSGAASAEELARGETFWRIKKNGQLSYQGVSPDANLADGEALIAVKKATGGMRVQDSRMGLGDAKLLEKHGSQILKAADIKPAKPGTLTLPKGSATQPLEAYIQARSSLSEMARKSHDPIVRRGMQSALDEMNDTIEREMKLSGIPGLYENFQEANRLWAKGKALQRVGEAIDKATPGVPSKLQTPGLAARPPEIKPVSLVQQLKKLDAKGDLTRGFGDTQKTALYKVADILDRQTGVGLPPGELELWKSIKHMTSAPYRHAIVKIMTSPEGAKVINSLAEAQLPSKVAAYSAQLSRMADSARAERWLPGQVQPPPGAQADTQ